MMFDAKVRFYGEKLVDWFIGLLVD